MIKGMIAGAVTVVAAIVMAPTANADTDNDISFMQHAKVDLVWTEGSTDQGILKAGHSTCGALQRGVSKDTIAEVLEATDHGGANSLDDVKQFIF